jgi:hypothetical protein
MIMSMRTVPGTRGSVRSMTPGICGFVRPVTAGIYRFMRPMTPGVCRFVRPVNVPCQRIDLRGKIHRHLSHISYGLLLQADDLSKIYTVRMSRWPGFWVPVAIIVGHIFLERVVFCVRISLVITSLVIRIRVPTEAC